MDIKDKVLTDARLFVDNHTLNGEVVEVDSKNCIVFSVDKNSHFHTSEMDKRGSILCKVEGMPHFVAGRIFVQSQSRVLMCPETELQPDRRSELRYETPSIVSQISGKRGMFRKERFNATIINISLHGALIECHQDIDASVEYLLETSFPYHHQTVPFSANFKKAGSRKHLNMFLNRIIFSIVDGPSKENLGRYLDVLCGNAT